MTNTRPLGIWPRVLLTLAVGVSLSLAIYWLSDLLNTLALSERGATCLDEGCFCEAHGHSFPAQVSNAFSSLAFLFLGVWALLSTKEPVRGTRERVLKPYFAATMLFLGASSFFYHSTLSFFGQFLDIFSMYTFGILLAVGALYRSGRIGGVVAIAIFVSASVIFGALQYSYPDLRRVLFALLLLPGIVLELTPFITGYGPKSPKVRFIYFGVGILLIAYVIWTLDQNGIVCDPISLVQGHAVWHVLTAVAAFMIFLHYRQTPHAPK
jgi:hypothetical protein